MNSIDLFSNLETILPSTIALTDDQLEQARQQGLTIQNPSQQWQTYLNTLALLGFEQWLRQRASDVSITSPDNSLIQTAEELPVICNVVVNDFRVCLIPIESQPDEVELPAIAVTSPELASHFYISIVIYEEQSQIAVHSFLRYDQLIAQIPLLQPDSNQEYNIPITHFNPDLNCLLLYLRCSLPSAIALPKIQQVSVSPYSPLPTPVRLSAHVEAHSPLINVRRWLQNELDALAQQLSWVLLPPTALENAMRLTAKVTNQPTTQEGFEGVVKQLVRNGMTLPSDARVAYQDLDVGTVAARLYAIAGTLPVDENPPEWTLLIVLGARSHTPLPDGTQLQIRESETVLVQQSLSPPDAYLYAKVIGTLEEQFSVIVTTPDHDTLTLPPFAFQANS